MHRDTVVIRGHCLCAETAGYYEFKWDHTVMCSRATSNPNGTSGWATILASTNPAVRTRTMMRIHLCTHNPCRAAWEYASKYGTVGPPMHLQHVAEHADSSSAAGPPGSTLAPFAAVAGPPAEMSPVVVEPAPSAPAPVETPGAPDDMPLCELWASMPDLFGDIVEQVPVEMPPLPPPPNLPPGLAAEPAPPEEPTQAEPTLAI